MARSGQVIAGSPEEIIEPMREMKEQLLDLGFDSLVIGLPLGPSVPDALQLLGGKVLPASLA